jgi:hypothetical protein
MMHTFVSGDEERGIESDGKQDPAKRQLLPRQPGLDCDPSEEARKHDDSLHHGCQFVGLFFVYGPFGAMDIRVVVAWVFVAACLPSTRSLTPPCLPLLSGFSVAAAAVG